MRVGVFPSTSVLAICQDINTYFQLGLAVWSLDHIPGQIRRVVVTSLYAFTGDSNFVLEKAKEDDVVDRHSRVS